MLRCPEFTTLVATTTTLDVHANRRSREESQLAVRLERRIQSQMLRLIRIHICENELQLFGQVGSWYEKQQAQEIAREVAPMCRIRNELRVGSHHG